MFSGAHALQHRFMIWDIHTHHTHSLSLSLSRVTLPSAPARPHGTAQHAEIQYICICIYMYIHMSCAVPAARKCAVHQQHNLPFRVHCRLLTVTTYFSSLFSPFSSFCYLNCSLSAPCPSEDVKFGGLGLFFYEFSRDSKDRT